MTPEQSITAYNLFMIICACWTAFWLGRAYEVGRSTKDDRDRYLDELIAVYKSQRR